MKYKLADVLKNKTQGVNTTTDKIKYVDIGYKIVQAKNIEEYNVTFDENNYIDEETFNRVKENHKLHKGDVLYTNIGSQLGNSALYNSDEKAIITWNVMKLIPNEKLISSEFLCYLLNSNKLKIKTLNSSSTMPFVSGKELMNFEINIPALEIQNKITKILNMIQSKIRLNNQINDNLYSLIDSLYKDGILDKYEKNHKLLELYNFQYGKGNNNPDNNGIYPVYGSNGIIGGYTEFNNEEAPVIGHIGANCGSLIFAFGKHFVTYNGVMCMIKNEDFKYFGYVTMRFLNFRNEIRGSSQPFVSYDLLDNMNIPLPENEIIKKYEKLFKPLFKIINNNLNQNKNLEQLRDTLLPKLMNGEIDLDKIEI